MSRINSFDELCDMSPTWEVLSAFVKAYRMIHGYDDFAMYNRIMVSVSGGSDSDIVMDFTERIGYPNSSLIYVFFDTGMEFRATLEHLDFLEKKYGVTILREKAKVPVPAGCRKYGVPFLSKQTSEWISRLQKHGFDWTDQPFDRLYARFPRCKAALRWWCNEWEAGSQANISRVKHLKEFMIENPPDFPISPGCCNGAKKQTAKAVSERFSPDLDIQGIRRAEGGARTIAYKSCFDEVFGGCDSLRPIFRFRKADKAAYDRAFGVTHSRCYTEYGLKRTGCACCPFGADFEHELKAAQQHEPLLYTAATNVFGKSYDYTRRYREFCVRRGN